MSAAVTRKSPSVLIRRKELRRLTPGQLALAEQRLRTPPPGSRIEAARDSGVDLTLLIEQLRLTPADRVHLMHQVSIVADQVRGAARTRRE